MAVDVWRDITEQLKRKKKVKTGSILSGLNTIKILRRNTLKC